MTKKAYTKRMEKKGFTLIEVIIVTAIVGLLSVGVLSANFIPSLQKGRDGKRKQDLQKMTRVLGDYLNDHNRYPPAVNGTIDAIAWGGSFTPYTPSLPKDPFSPGRDYYYLSDDQGKSYFIFATLENTKDPDSATVGCADSCGPYDNKRFNFVVHSGNVEIQNGTPWSEYYPPPI